MFSMTATTMREAETARARATTWRLSFGEGLLLEVKPTGSKTWLLRFMLDGKRRDMGLGGFPGVTLKEARAKAEAARRIVTQQGEDPIEARHASRVAATAARAVETEKRARTFRDCAEALLNAQSPAWTSPKTAASWRLTFDKHAFPKIGDMPIAEIARADVVRTLAPIWTSQPPTARKLQRRVAAVLDFAAANGWRAADNPGGGRVLRLTKALPAMRAEGRHWPSLPSSAVPAFMAALVQRDGIAALALRLAILSALRSNEVRQARWSEFDLEARVWTLPGSKMKGGRAKARQAHRVPLTTAMLDILVAAAALRTEEDITLQNLPVYARSFSDNLVFTSARGGPFSDAAMGAVIKRMNEDHQAGSRMPWLDADGRTATQHGFRRSFRSWTDDERPEDAAAAEAQLAHEEQNRVARAYRGSDLLGRRVGLMSAWTGYCMSKIAACVIPLRASVADQASSL
jgi:integrase